MCQLAHKGQVFLLGGLLNLLVKVDLIPVELFHTIVATDLHSLLEILSYATTMFATGM